MRVPVLQTRFLAICLLLALLASPGCSFLSPTPSATGKPTPVLAQTPAAGAAALATSAGTGGVRGRLIVEGTGKPYLATLYLGRTISASQPGVPPIISYSESSDPQVTNDRATGDFEFKNVAAGTYAPLVWSPSGSVVLHKPGSSDPILIEVKAGQIADIGTVPIR
jgi:hypothetical protein